MEHSPMKDRFTKRAEVLYTLKNMLLGTKDTSESLLKEVLIHLELISNPDIVLNKRFRSLLENKVRTTREMVGVALERDRIECTKISREVTTCPISQKEVVFPYVSHCGHVLERREAIKYLENNPQATCPYIGCNKILVEKGG